jgi:diaminopimelate decarboxylase
VNPFTEESAGFHDFAIRQPTPAIVYDIPRIRRTVSILLDLCAPFGGRCFFSVKSNRTHRILAEIAACGFGADIASRQELSAALDAGHTQFVATCPGLTPDVMRTVSDQGGVIFFDGPEQIAAAKTLGVEVADHGLRVSLGGRYRRFGIDPQNIADLCAAMSPAPTKFHFHYGEIETLSNLAALLGCVDGILERTKTSLVDLGGGYGVLSNDWAVMKAAFSLIGEFAGRRKVDVAFEFGKVVSARSGSLVTSVTARKCHGERQTLFVDASSYNLGTLERRRLRHRPAIGEPRLPTTIVGSTCYEDDIFVANQPAPAKTVGDKLVFGSCGAYAASVAGSLHGLPPPPEIFFEP